MISVIGISTFIGYSRNNALSQATSDFVNGLNTVKSKAYSQVKPVAIASCVNGELDGYGVKWTTASSYALIVRCSGVDTTLPLSTVTLKNITLAPASRTIFFRVYTGGVLGVGDVTISNTFGNSKTVNVSSAGVIKVL